MIDTDIIDRSHDARRHYVHTVRPRCPACGSTKLRSYHTAQNGDGSVTRHSRCLDCGARLLVVAE